MLGKSWCSCSRFAAAPGAIASRPASGSYTETSSPRPSTPTRSSPLSRTKPPPSRGRTVGAGAPPRASAGAAPNAGTPSRPCGAALNTTVPGPLPASAANASPTIPSSSAATSAYVRAASRCTHAIDVPGRMSWNWCSSTVFHSRSSASYGYGKPVRTAAVAAHSSASCSRCSPRRLPCLVRAWLVSVARCSSRYSSPTHTGACAYSAWAFSKNADGFSKTTRAEPSRSVSRRALASISRVVPPPPSPQPVGASERVAPPFSRKLRTACASSWPDNWAL